MIAFNPTDFKSGLIRWYRTASELGEIPYWIVFAIALYIPFEEFTVKWLPLAVVWRFVPELILYALALKILIQRLFIDNCKWKQTPIDWLLLLFFLSTIISILLNGSKLFPAVENIRALWRYLSVYYIIVNIDISTEKLKLLLKGIKTVAIVQTSLAILQFFMPASFNAFFAPKQFKIGDIERISAAEKGKLKAGSVSGTFANPAVLASFLLIAFIIGLSQFFFKSSVDINVIAKDFSSSFVLLLGIFASKKRAAFVLALLAPVILLWYQKRFRSVAKLTWAYAAIIFAVILALFIFGVSVDTSFSGADSKKETIEFTSYIAQLFSPEYYARSAENSRGWVIRITFQSLIQSGSWFGFGPDLENMRGIIFDLLVDGGDRRKIFALEPLEDVYWMAMLAYYGVVGMSLFFLMLWRLFKAGRWLSKYGSNVEYKALGNSYCTLITLTLVYNFITRVFELRPFSFYFWLLSGLVVNIYNRQLIQRKIQAQHLSSVPKTP